MRIEFKGVRSSCDMSNVSRTGKEEINSATSPTTFGKSVESQAQMQDAAAEASPETGGEMLNIYRLEPIAAPDDPRWDNAPGHGIIIVAARTPGDARIVAAARELDFMQQGRIVASGAPQDVLSEDLLRDVFSVEARIEASPYHSRPQIHYLK